MESCEVKQSLFSLIADSLGRSDSHQNDSVDYYFQPKVTSLQLDAGPCSSGQSLRATCVAARNNNMRIVIKRINACGSTRVVVQPAPHYELYLESGHDDVLRSVVTSLHVVKGLQ